MGLFRDSRASAWRATKNGSYWRHVEDGEGVTVFWNEVRDAWCWVYDGEFDDESYESSAEAMEAAEEALDL